MLSFGTAGCNLGCRFCQNWDISKAREHDRLQSWASPEGRVQKRNGDLLARLGILPGLPDFGLDAVTVSPDGEIILSRARSERAKNLLLNPNLRVSEIAFEVGFQSLTHFNRVFKGIVGESPTEYRGHLPKASRQR